MNTNFLKFISYIIFISNIILFSTIVRKTKNVKNTKYSLIAYIIIIAILSYFFTPTNPIDLTRQQEELIQYKMLNFKELLRILFETPEFSKPIYFWLIAKSGLKDLMQTGAAIIYYSVIFYIIYDFTKNNSISTKTESRTLAFFMLLGQYIFVVSGIRTAISFAIFVFCYYRECFKNKSFQSNLLLYLISIGFHSCTIPIFIIRLFFVFFSKNVRLRDKIINYIIAFLMVFIIMKYNAIIMSSFLDKIESYLSKVSYYHRPEYILAGIKYLIFLILSLTCFKDNNIKEKFKDLKHYKRFITLIFIVTAAYSFQYTIFTRYTNLLSMLILPVYVLDFEYIIKKCKKKYNFTILYLAIYLLLFVLFTISYCKGYMSIINFFK